MHHFEHSVRIKLNVVQCEVAISHLREVEEVVHERLHELQLVLDHSEVLEDSRGLREGHLGEHLGEVDAGADGCSHLVADRRCIILCLQRSLPFRLYRNTGDDVLDLFGCVTEINGHHWLPLVRSELGLNLEELVFESLLLTVIFV